MKNSLFSIISLGCFKNLIDSEVIIGQLIQKGMYLTDNFNEAEIIIVNTCGFINPARKESIKTIKEIALMKKKGNCKKLIVVGCLVQRDKERLKEIIPDIDYLVGIDDIPKISDLIHKNGLIKKTISYELPKWIYDGEAPRALTGRNHYSFIKIAEGCNHKCSFCIIPLLKGKYRSRSISSIVDEAEGLAKSGVKELILISQDTTFYGNENGEFNLINLLKELLKIKQFKWVRLLYLHPDHLNKELIHFIAQEERICKYFDLPFQHCNEKILKLMKRAGNKEKYLNLIYEIRKEIPDASIRTSLIVGFPGESEKEFNELLEFCLQAKFDNLGVFLYYDEKEAESYSLPLKVPYQTKLIRKKEILSLQRKLLISKNKKLTERVFECIIDDKEGNKFIMRHQGMAPEIDGCIMAKVDDNYKIGDFVKVRIQGGRIYQLKGIII